MWQRNDTGMVLNEDAVVEIDGQCKLLAVTWDRFLNRSVWTEPNSAAPIAAVDPGFLGRGHSLSRGNSGPEYNWRIGLAASARKIGSCLECGNRYSDNSCSDKFRPTTYGFQSSKSTLKSVT